MKRRSSYRSCAPTRCVLLSIALVTSSGCNPSPADPGPAESSTACGPADSSGTSSESQCTGFFQCVAPVEKCQVSVAISTDLPDRIISGSPACVIDELLSTSPGRAPVYIVKTLTDAATPTFSDVRTTVIVYGDGSAASLERGVTAPGNVPYTRVELRPAEHFASCRASLDPFELRDCLLDFFVPGSCIAPVYCPFDGPCD